MKLLLIAPASGKWRNIGKKRLFNGKTFRFSLLSLLSVAAETPEDVDIKIVDEQIEEIPLHESFELVGITCMTAAAPRAYEIADRFRMNGMPVVLGGMHPSFLPDEAQMHADAVVVGEAETVWRDVIRDARNGCMKKRYQTEQRADLSQLKTPPRRLLRDSRYSTLYAVQATRGCPNRCAFCSVSAFHGCEHRRRPVDDVADEVKRIPSKAFMFIDDNLTSNHEYAYSLFDAMKPHKKIWISQVSLDFAENEDLVKAAADAGCVGVFIGLETFSTNNLQLMNKEFNRIQQYKNAIKKLHAYGIGVESGVVFGFDGDHCSVFEETLRRLDELEIDLAQFSIFTPLPGTPIFKKMRHRILDRNWTHYDFHHAVFEPQGMSAEALQAGHDWITREFYRPWRIAKRLYRYCQRPRAFQSLAYAAAINAAYYGRVKSWGFQGWNPAEDFRSSVDLRMRKRAAVSF